MNCSSDLIEAYLDEELDAGQRAAVEQHLTVCADCSEVWVRLRDQKAAFRAAAPYYSAPLQLGQSIRDALRRSAAGETRPPVSGLFWRPLAIAACLLLAVSLSWNLRGLRSRTSENSLAESVLTGHLRSLLGDRLVDVVSSDRHTVKPWFTGKLEFSPTVKDLESEGFALQGGRLEYLAGRRVAALVYRRRQHVINLFIWPAGASPGGETRISRDGYNLLHWTDGAITYWAASDVSADELERFRKLYRQ